MNRANVRTGSAIVAATMCLMFGVAMLGYGNQEPYPSAMRHVKGRTIVSRESPKARLSIRSGFRLIGTQHINIRGDAEAEQYLFVRSGTGNMVKSFYLIQFERFLPTNTFAYDYASRATTQLGNLSFNYDVRSFLDLGSVLREDQGSDGAAMEQLFA